MAIPRFPLNVALAGFGAAGRFFHSPFITTNPRLRLIHVLERRTTASPGVYPHVSVLRDLDDLLAAPGIDLVVIATPNHTHFDLASRALRAGKHVVVDKPVATSADEARQLASDAAQRNLLLAVYHNRRWDGDFLTVQDLLAQQRLGRLVAYESHFDRFRPQPQPGRWREQPAPGAGLLFDLGPHLIDQACLLFDAPRTVTADVRVERDAAAVDDSFDLRLGYPRLTVTLRAGTLIKQPRPRFALYGTAGSFVKFGLDPQEAALRAGRSPCDRDWGVERAEDWGILETERGGPERVPTRAGGYAGFYDNICDAIAGLAPLAVTPAQAVRVIAIIETAFRSSAERRTIEFSD
jgi:scyllo-inositol 2-dehydrogenase (NADP+)